MKKVLLALAVSLFAVATAQAAQVVGDVVAVVEKANCTLVAKESTTGSTLVGGAAGAVGGAVLGRLVGGKKGTGWGALLGGGAGALVGHNSGDETYNCKLMVDADGERLMVETMSEKKLTRGDKITLVRTDDGKLSVM